MNRFTRFGLATLLAFAFTACDEGTPPPVEPPPPPTPVGTISGTVTIEGTAAAGITATLSSGATTTTGSGGSFAFSGVEAGTYTVTISGFPEDATFASVTQSATIATDGQNVQLNFAGEYVRSSAVVGNVVAADAMMSGGDGQPETLAGVTVKLDGEHAMGEAQETGMDGGFAFTGLRAGTYTVTISGFPEDVSFETVSVEVEVGVGEVGQADFTGHFIRTSAVEGSVVIEGEGLAAVTVTLAGGPADESFTTATGADGMYRFESLRRGDYTVSISDFDARDYEFASTSADVSVDLDETGTVSFTGVLLRTSGISGRVSVEGMGLGDIAVTLSGAADASTMTDAGGQYAFAGLAAGDYTVSVAVSDPAYVFDSMSTAVTVGDDESAIVNFDGAHARTASVSGMLYVDEATKNDAYDTGEDAFAAPNVPVALVGPGVNEQRISATDPSGAFSFSGLRAGAYQLVVLIDAQVAAALGDYAYGGPSTGYEIALGVGESHSQAIPFDITHQTVNFSVMLRSGDAMGAALPGAMVTLYSDGRGQSRIGTGTTGDDGMASIRIARAGTGGMVYAGVSATGYNVADDMTTVEWNPQLREVAASNDFDVFNPNVNVTLSGATVMTDFGGGDPLAGWAIGVTSGGAAVAGAPSMLGADGTAAFATSVSAVPVEYSIDVASDQSNDLDGGESYSGSAVTYTHDGLSLMGAQAADGLEVRFTTQTLMVYVHHEVDQVRGFTGNVGHLDVRSSDIARVEVRQVSGADDRFTRTISGETWDSDNGTDKNGVYTFRRLPADLEIVVRAYANSGHMVLHTDRLDTYRDMDANGLMGGAFGEHGGFGHTVSLCPLTEVEPTGQDHGKCASFAVVKTHNVTAEVSKMAVGRSSSAFGSPRTVNVKNITVSLIPVEGKNLSGDGRSFTTAASDDRTTPIDERKKHDFGPMPAGTYDLGIPGGWMGMAGTERAAAALDPLDRAIDIDITPSTATLYGFVRNTDGFGLASVTVDVNGMTAVTDDLGRYILAGISPVRKQVFVNTARAGYPATKPDSMAFGATADIGPNKVFRHDFKLRGANNTVTITGTVTESGTGAPIKGVTITVDGKAPLNAPGSKLTTGDDGTYVAVVEAQPFDDPLVNVSASKTGYHFLPTRSPVAAIPGANPTANFEGRRATEITGKVTGPGGGMPKAEVTVTAWADAAMTDSVYAVTTTETGTFSVFVPTLSGSVYLDAQPRDDYDPTNPNYHNLRDSERYTWFDPPANRAGGQIAVIPGQALPFGTFTGYSVQPRIAKVTRRVVTTDVEADGLVAEPTAAARGFRLVKGEPTDVIVVTWHYETKNTAGTDADGNALPYTAAHVADDANLETARGPRFTAFGAPSGGFTTPVSAIRGTRTRANPAGTAGRGTASNGTTVKHDRITTYILPEADDHDYRDIHAKIGHAVVDAEGTTRANTVAESAPAALAGVKSGVRSLKVTRDRDIGQGNEVTTDEIDATWFGPGSPQLEHRIALRVWVEDAGPTGDRWEWIVFGTITQPTITRRTDPNQTSHVGANWGRWSSASFDLNGAGNEADNAWEDDDDPDLDYAVTITNLLRATHLRVDTRVDNGGKWAKGTPVTIPSP